MTFNHYDIGSNPVNSSLNTEFFFFIYIIINNYLLTDVLKLVDKPILGIGDRNIV